MVLGGPTIGGPTLTRFFALHVFVIPGTLLALVGLHVWMVLKLGINDWPMPGRIVRKSTYERQYHELTERTGIAFVPDAAWKDAIFAAVILLSVLVVALIFGPIGPNGMPDPTIIQTAPKPDFAFLWVYAILAFLPPALETPLLLIVPPLVIVGMLLLPLVAGEGEKHWSRRPVAVLMVVVIALMLGIFTRLGTYTPWSPVMDAWSSDAVPPADLQGRNALQHQGALVFQNKQCRNCHQLAGVGGQRGPALDTIAARMSEDQLIRQVLQGGRQHAGLWQGIDAVADDGAGQFSWHAGWQGRTAASIRSSHESWPRWREAAGSRSRRSGARHIAPTLRMQGSFNVAGLLQDWHPPLPITAGCVLTLAVYLRGFVLLRRTRPQYELWRACNFIGGIAVLWLALASPLEELADTVLTAHMLEHLLLMVLVPPLVWLGWPVVPLTARSARTSQAMAGLAAAAIDTPAPVGAFALVPARCMASHECDAAAVAHPRGRTISR